MPKNRRKIWKGIFFIYLLILIRLIIFKYPWEHLVRIMHSWQKGVILEGLSTANFVLGKSIKMYIRYFDRFPFWNGVANLFGNILVFIPYGILLPKAYPVCRRWWRILYCAVGFVVCIELFQLFSAFGAFDVDDIFLNVLGAMAGYGIYVFFHKIKIRYRAEKYFRKWKMSRSK